MYERYIIRKVRKVYFIQKIYFKKYFIGNNLFPIHFYRGKILLYISTKILTNNIIYIKQLQFNKHNNNE